MHFSKLLPSAALRIFRSVAEKTRYSRSRKAQFEYEKYEARQMLAAITWSSGDITENSDVSNNGTLVFALNASGTQNTGSTTVDGVTFAAALVGNAGAISQAQSPGDESISTTIVNDNDGAFENGGLDANGIGNIIQGGWWGANNNSASVTLTGLTVGDVYEVQIFANDARGNRHEGYVTRLGDGAGGFGVDLQLNNQPNGSRPGDFGIGTFTADSTSQSISVSGFLDGSPNSGRAHVNAIQLRNLEPLDLLPGSVPLINEFSASNAGVIDDDNGNSSDWIELYNAGEDAVDLAGYSLTDDASNPTKYVLPSTTLEGGQYLVVFAGDDADPTTGSDLYTGFGLKAGGEYLGFYDPSGNLISEFGPGGSDYPQQFTDVSYGLEASVGVPGADDLGDFASGASFTIDTAGSNYDTELGLFDAAGNLLAEDDDAIGLQSQISAGTLVDGTYFIALGGFDTSFSSGFDVVGGSDSGDFTLTVNGSSVNGSTISNEVRFFSFNVGTATTPGVTFFATPTPGSANVDPVDGVIESLPLVSVDRGFKEQAFTVDITSTVPGATLVYTTDGSEPSLTNGIQVVPANGTSVVQASLLIDETTSLRTGVFRTGFLTSGFTTHTYVFLDDVISSSVLDTTITSEYTPEELRAGLLDIPTLSFNYDTEITDSFVPEQAASIEWLAPDGSEGFQVDAGISGFGGFFTNFAKKNFRVEFRSEYGASQLEFPLFEGFDNGIPATDSFDSLDFRSGSHDRVQRGFGLSNRFVDDTLLEAGHAVPHGRFVHIYNNGVYWGQYHMRERWDADFLSQYYGGEEDDYEAVNGNINNGNPTPNGWALGEVYDGSGEAWTNITQLADQDGSGNPTGGYQELKEAVNLPQYLDYLLVWMAGRAENEFRAGGSIDGSVPYTFTLNDADGWLRGTSDNTGNAGPGNIYGTLVDEGDPEFLTLLSDRINNMFGEGGVLSPERATERLQTRLDEMELSFVLESARWSSINEARTPDSFDSAANSALSNMLPNLASAMIENFRARGLYVDFDAPSFEINGTLQNGGAIESGDLLTLDAEETIYYTTDGTDPRLVGGGINPNAIAFDASTSSTTVFPEGSVWKYLDDGSNQGAAWRSASFDDSSWASGASELGFGDDPVTLISFGGDPNDVIATTYFRRTFEVTESFDTATLDLFYDDGAIVYLNGIEIGRTSNLSGNVTWETFASSSVGDGANISFDISSALQLGTNTLAIEIHQGTAGSSDLSFNAELTTSIEIGQSGSVPLTTSTNVQARTFRNGEWSGLSNAIFALPASQSDLRISEIYYNPSVPTAAEIAVGYVNNNDFEFIELVNAHPSGGINLNGVQFVDGITFDFGDVDLLPGERVVIARNVAAFTFRYGSDITVLGEWSGGLNNGGESLELVDSDSNEIMRVNFGDNDPWYIPTDGHGFSLVLDDPFNTPVDELGKYYSWRASTEFGGTPGEASAESLGIVVNEILAHSGGGQVDTIELYNPTGSSIDIGGWFLSDEGDDLLKFEIPTGTVISAGGYLVFDETDFNPTPANPGPNDFALSASSGDQVYLSRGSSGTFTGLEDAVEFDATFSGDSLGRLPNGSGRLVRLAENSFGSVNGGHALSDVIISEINYNPGTPSSAALAIDALLTDDDLEFIEINNVTGSTIDLTNWRLRGESDYDFAAGTTLAAGGSLAVLSFDPSDPVNATRLEAFLAHYGLSSSANLVGGFSGGLSNGSGRIALQQPDTPDEFNAIPGVVVDEVVYDDLGPWADADGTGDSLVRDSVFSLGISASSWLASTPTPGTATTTSGTTSFDVGTLGFGVAAQDDYSGTGYLLYSSESVFTRFASSAPHPSNATNLIAVRLEGTQWQYDNNDAWVNFTTVSGDRLLASIDFTADTITSLEGTSGVVEGIDSGYDSGDLVFTANQWNGGFNDGEFGITGTFFEVGPVEPSTSVDIGALGFGVAAQDDYSGTGYLLYTSESVFTRFASSPPHPSNATNLIAVRLERDSVAV